MALVMLIAVAAIAVAATPAFAATDRNKHISGTVGPITQTHTLFFSTTPCTAGGEGHWTGYAFKSWNTRFQRTAGADREIAKVKYETGAFGFACATGAIATHDTGVSTYYPRFGSSNDITYTLQLNWPMIFPDFNVGSVGSSTKGYYGYRTGHPGSIAATICTNVDAKIDFNSGDFDLCGDL